MRKNEKIYESKKTISICLSVSLCLSVSPNNIFRIYVRSPLKSGEQRKKRTIWNILQVGAARNSWKICAASREHTCTKKIKQTKKRD